MKLGGKDSMSDRMDNSQVLDADVKALWAEFSPVVGRMLTQMEAAFPDKIQREANKKVIEQELYKLRENVTDLIISIKRRK